MLAILLTTCLGSLPSSTVPPTAPSLASFSATVPHCRLLRDDYKDAKEEVLAAYAVALDEVAKQCQKIKAPLERNLAYETILKIDPEQKTARRYLKYTFDREAEEWIRKRKYKAPKRAKAAKFKAAREVRAKADAVMTEAMLALMETHAEDIKRIEAYDERVELLDLATNDLTLRTVHGDVAVETDEGTAWLRKETVACKARRKEIEAFLAAARKKAPDAKTGELTKLETEWGVEWVAPLETDRVRVIAMTDAAERAQVLETIHLASELFQEVLGGEVKKPRPSTVYLLDGEDHVPAIAKTCKKLSARWKDILTERQDEYDHFWIDDSGLAVYGHTPEYRIDTALHQATEKTLSRRFKMMSLNNWALSGFGHYFTELVLGTRITYPSGPWSSGTSSVSDEDGDVKDPKADWMAISKKIIDERKSFKLEELLGFTFSTNGDNYVLSYAFARFLCEGLGPEMTAKVLAAFGKRRSEEVDEVMMKAFGEPCAVVERQFEAWLAQMVEGDA